MLTFLDFLKNKNNFILESIVSDQYEKVIANNITEMSKLYNYNIIATRPHVNTSYSDVLITDTKNNKTAWLEVKMNHTDNLSNPRFRYENGKWHIQSKSLKTMPTAIVALDILNKSVIAKEFVYELAKFCNIEYDKIIIPSTKGELAANVNIGISPTLSQMSEFVNNNWKFKHYICKTNYNKLGELICKQYLTGKAEPVYYLQAGDDLYRLSDENPLNFKDLPLYSGIGTFNIRVSTRSKFYEIQAEIKIDKNTIPVSNYSFKPNSKKNFIIIQ